METSQKAVPPAPSNTAEPAARSWAGPGQPGRDQLARDPGPQQQSVRVSLFLSAAFVGAYILGILFKRNGNFAISLPRYTSVAMTHSSLSSDMTYTDWYLVSFEVEYTESGLFLSDASLPLSVGVPVSSPVEPCSWHLVARSLTVASPFSPCTRLQSMPG